MTAVLARAVRSRTLRWSLVDAAVVVYALLPLTWLASLSLKTPATAGDGHFVPRELTLRNYASIFTAEPGQFVRPLVNSVGITVIATAVAVAIGGMAAYAVARLDFPGRRALIAGSLLVAMLPQVSVVVPLFEIERRTGLLDTWAGLILPYVAFALPLAIYVLSAFFAEFPAELEKAAQLDGATPAQAFVRVIMPLALPGILTAAILVFLFTWNDFLFALALTSTEAARTVPATLVFIVSSSPPEAAPGTLAAAAVVITIPVLVFVLAFQRRIVAGLTAGVVKE